MKNRGCANYEDDFLAEEERLDRIEEENDDTAIRLLGTKNSYESDYDGLDGLRC